MHGGRIGATSDGEGRGSTFYVIVPLYPAVAAPAKAKGRSFDAAVDAAVHASLDQGRAASPVVGGRGLQQQGIQDHGDRAGGHQKGGQGG